MSHPQAYHTSCREGLGGHSGFQFNAASTSIGADLLAALAGAHAGYHPPRDYPPAPTREQLATFPVTLKYQPVDGLPVVSQTMYVGREYRGDGDQQEAGRFGNYFSHIVLAAEHHEPFDGLLPIELWRAPHWQTAESSTRELPELGALAPGACTLQWTLALLDGALRAWRGALLDATLAAIDGGPRVVLVESDTERAAAWVAWVTYALPPELAGRLSFSTFEGQPRYADGLHLCITTPGCDLTFAGYELGRDVVVLEPTTTEAPATRTLYGRVMADLAEHGADAVAEASRGGVGSQQGVPANALDTSRPARSDGSELPSAVDRAGASLEHRGAQLAVVNARMQLVEEQDVAAVLAVLVELIGENRWELAQATAEVLPETAADESTLRAWWRLYAAARACTAGAARALADQALARLLGSGSALPADLPEIPSAAPTSPSPGALAGWLALVERAPLAERADALARGIQLGLVGCNVAADRRVSQAICEAIAEPAATAAVAQLAGNPERTELLANVLDQLAAAAFADDRALQALRNLLAQPELESAYARFGEHTQTFQPRCIWESLRIEAQPDALRAALAELIPIAQREGRIDDVARLFGPSGPLGPDDHLALMQAYDELRIPPAAGDVERTLRVLAKTSLLEIERGERLTEALRWATSHAADGGARLRRDPALIAWVAAIRQPPQTRLARWAGWVEKAATDRLSDERYRELRELAGRVGAAAASRVHTSVGGGHDDADYITGSARLAEVFGSDWSPAAACGLQYELAHATDPAALLASVFVTWSELPPGTGELLHEALPQVVTQMSPRRVTAVEALLSDRERAAWAQWLEQHPPDGRVSKAVSRLMRREGGAR